MDKLTAELQRLYGLPGQVWLIRQSAPDGEAPSVPEIPSPGFLAAALRGDAAVAIDPRSPEGKMRTLAVDFARADLWDQASRLWEGIQADLELPAPAISVSGQDGYRLWISLAEPVAAAEAGEFLDGLHHKYLTDIPASQLRLLPQASASSAPEADLLDLVPALHPETGKWSAFIDPAMGGMFAEAPGLEMAPNPDKQADILAGFASVSPEDFQRALAQFRAGTARIVPPQLGPDQAPAQSSIPGAALAPPVSVPGIGSSIGSDFKDPKSFLLAVMNDPATRPELRIEAAKALLPYFG